jgi:hypothetical protein
MNQADVIGYVGAVFVFGTFWMKTMIPLRAFGLASNVPFIGYGYLAGAYPRLVLHILLLPLNVVRLRQMLQLTQQVARAAAGDLEAELWILKIKLTQLAVSYFQQFARFDALQRLRAGLVRREHRELADHGAGRNVDTAFHQTAVAGNHEEHPVRQVALAKQQIADVHGVRRGEWLDPIHVDFIELISKRLFENIARLETENAALRGSAAMQDQNSS